MNDLEISYTRKIIKNKQDKLRAAAASLTPEDDDDTLRDIDFKVNALDLADNAIYAMKGKA